ncbi:hypothetical protein BN128_3154 [Cronobacter sakazakii 696]|nr:hypothetical protein BN128_3154 [Cronobacter sakazakii 696]
MAARLHAERFVNNAQRLTTLSAVCFGMNDMHNLPVISQRVRQHNYTFGFMNTYKHYPSL